MISAYIWLEMLFMYVRISRVKEYIIVLQYWAVETILKVKVKLLIDDCVEELDRLKTLVNTGLLLPLHEGPGRGGVRDRPLPRLFPPAGLLLSIFSSWTHCRADCRHCRRQMVKKTKILKALRALTSTISQHRQKTLKKLVDFWHDQRSQSYWVLGLRDNVLMITYVAVTIFYLWL